MGFTGFVMSIVSVVFMAIAFIPFLGWLNWFVIPFALASLIVSAIGASRGLSRLLGVVGAIISLVVIPIAVVRLILGLGVF